MAGIGEFISHLWKVYPPEFAKDGSPTAVEKPPATLPTKDEIVEYDPNTDLKTDDDAQQVGVAIAQATYAMTGWSWYLMMFFLWIAYFCYAIDNQTTLQFNFKASTSLSGNSALYYTASAIQPAVSAVSRPVIGKICDIFGRFTGGCVTLFFYALGYLIMAVAQNNNTIVAGTAIYAVGNGGMNILLWVILADFLSSRMRAFGYGLLSMPIFIVYGIGPIIVNNLTQDPAHPTFWRWGYGFLDIIIPVCLLPIISILFFLEQKAKRTGLVPRHPYLAKGFSNACWQFFLDADIGGMIIIVAGFLFMLVALTRGPMVGWSLPWVIALLVVGGVLILFLPAYEFFISPRPFMRRRFLNSSVILAIIIGFFDFMSFQMTFQMFFAWLPVNTSLTSLDKEFGYTTFADTLALTLFGLLAGIVIWMTARYKYLIVIGGAIRLLAVGLMIRYRKVGSSMVQVVWPQILMGIGGGLVGDIVTISSQVTVRHQDVAMVTSVVLMWCSLGQAIGTAIYQAITASQLASHIEAKAPNAPADMKQNVAGGLGLSVDPTQDPAARQVAEAFNDISGRSLYACIAFTGFMFVCTWFVKDHVLTKSQNVVSAELPEKSPWHMASDDTYDEAIQEAQQENTQMPPSYSNHTAVGEHDKNGFAEADKI